MKQFKRALALILVLSFAFSNDLMATPKSVAVIVYPQSAMAKQYSRVALARLEQVLTDNGVTVLDQKGLTGARPGRPLYGPARQP